MMIVVSNDLILSDAKPEAGRTAPVSAEVSAFE
jgi:hypothetical protein